MTSYSAIYPWNNIAQAEFAEVQYAHDFDESSGRSRNEVASSAMSFLYLITAILPPFFGAMIDKVGQRSWWFQFTGIGLA